MKTRQYIQQIKAQRDEATAENTYLLRLNHELWWELSLVEEENAKLHQLITQLVGEGLDLMRDAAQQQRDILAHTPKMRGAL